MHDGRATHLAHPRQAGLSLSSRRRPGGCVESHAAPAKGALIPPPGAPFAAALLAALGCRPCGTQTRFATPAGPRRPTTTSCCTCSCGTEQRLDEMGLDEESVITLYECKRCTKSIVGVMTDDPDLR